MDLANQPGFFVGTAMGSIDWPGFFVGAIVGLTVGLATGGAVSTGADVAVGFSGLSLW